MHGLPTGFDFSPFVGTTLELVSFSENTVSFRLGDCLITVDASYEYRLGPHVVSVTEVVPPKTTAVLFLLGATVESVAQDGKGTLVLNLDHGRWLRIIEEDIPYECYRFVVKGQEYFV